MLKGANPVLNGFALLTIMTVLSSCTKLLPIQEKNNTAKVHVIEIKKFQFKPSNLMIRQGDIVRWENRDIVPHQIAEKTLKKWRSKNLSSNDAFSLKIQETVSYICKLHPTMRGKILIRTEN